MKKEIKDEEDQQDSLLPQQTEKPHLYGPDDRVDGQSLGLPEYPPQMTLSGD